ncbi:MAG: adenylate kinase [Elusimicrobia bacterium RIFOXYA12_FULL_51_18]|nr:MAG: adenylate kinase [Elusimicrobia bacterium RIFOXYA12_FULL_51_18]OGS28448.1 MAG: adenylate kinase [Elusimicrobia bacterium RIFOXYA2_FULL_53_38]
MNLVLLGYPGSGKGTQAKILSGKFSLFHISTGDIFREAIAAKTQIGVEVSGYLSAGRLVPDKLVLEVIKTRLAKETRGLLFDGFPRTVDQAQGLDDYFASRGQCIDAVVFLDVDEESVVGRLGSRRTCSKCLKIYNLLTSPPAKEGLCDSCGAKLMLREDDNPDVIRRRIGVYKDQTEPLAAYYKGLGNFYPVKGGQDPEIVAAEIAAVLKNNVK